MTAALVFTEEITYSSTKLINQHLTIFDPHIREHLHGLRQNGVAQQITQLMERIAGLHVLVVGEAIVDEYRYVLPMGKAPKENIIATRLQDREIFMGGAIATANNAAAFCESVERRHRDRRARQLRAGDARRAKPQRLDALHGAARRPDDVTNAAMSTRPWSESCSRSITSTTSPLSPREEWIGSATCCAMPPPAPMSSSSTISATA